MWPVRFLVEAASMAMNSRSILILATAFALSGGAARADESRDDGENGYRWWTTAEQDSAQYGVPESDDRGLRLDCEPSGMISIMGPTAAEPEGSKVMVTLQGRGGRRTLEGFVVALGDGNNFNVEVEADDDAVATLMAGHDLIVGSAGDEWTVPGKGAARALGPVLKVCETR
jgi:hypothetical protein